MFFLSIVCSYYVYENKVIGKGTHGIVKLASINNEQCVVKENSSSRFALSALKNEAQVMSRLNHQYIVVYKGSVAVSTKKYLLFMEKCDQSLPYRLANRKIDILESIRIFYQVANALYFMHSKGFCHLDIKPGNVLICNNVYKLCDFSLSRKQCHMHSTSLGTSLYMAPELYANLNSNKRFEWNGYKADVHSLGIMALQILDNKHTLNRYTLMKMVESYRIADNLNASARLQLLNDKNPTIHGLNILFVNILLKMVDRNAKSRPSMSQVLRDPFWNYHANFMARLSK
eukprot:NODE_7_length_48057_cov_0.322240.p13 type:complete len:287 gc:universal NODE_7_length_48057_cov_0.322240:19920-19060(-)